MKEANCLLVQSFAPRHMREFLTLLPLSVANLIIPYPSYSPRSRKEEMLVLSNLFRTTLSL